MSFTDAEKSGRICGIFRERECIEVFGERERQKGLLLLGEGGGWGDLKAEDWGEGKGGGGVMNRGRWGGFNEGRGGLGV